jgi:hypothetical protein
MKSGKGLCITQVRGLVSGVELLSFLPPVEGVQGLAIITHTSIHLMLEDVVFKKRGSTAVFAGVLVETFAAR